MNKTELHESNPEGEIPADDSKAQIKAAKADLKQAREEVKAAKKRVDEAKERVKTLTKLGDGTKKQKTKGTKKK